MLNKKEKKILFVLKKHPEGLMIKELAEILNSNRITISKYIYALEKLGKIKIRKYGNAKVIRFK